MRHTSSRYTALDSIIHALLYRQIELTGLQKGHLNMMNSSVHSVLPTDAEPHSFLAVVRIDPSGWSKLT